MTRSVLLATRDLLALAAIVFVAGFVVCLMMYAIFYLSLYAVAWLVWP